MNRNSIKCDTGRKYNAKYHTKNALICQIKFKKNQIHGFVNIALESHCLEIASAGEWSATMAWVYFVNCRLNTGRLWGFCKR